MFERTTYTPKCSLIASIRSAFFCVPDLILLAWQKVLRTVTVSLFKFPFFATSSILISTKSGFGFLDAESPDDGALRFPADDVFS